MNSRRRITAALIALLLLVLGVWLGQQVLSAQHEHQPAGVLVDNP